MQTRSALSHPFCAGALSAVLALVWFDSALAPEVNPARRLAQHLPPFIRFMTPETGVHIQRVDFVLDRAPPARDDEAQKKRKAEQRRAASAKSKPNVKAASEAGAVRGTPSAAAGDPTSEVATGAAARPVEQGSRAAASAPTPASTADTGATSSAAQKPVASANPKSPGTGRPPKLSRDQLLALLPGSTMLRTNRAGALRQWVNKPDGTLTVYWGGGGLRNGAHSASGRWSITDEGRFCLHIDWEDLPENWCRFLEPTVNGEYQPIADIADANWTPPTDKTNWRPLTIRH